MGVVAAIAFIVLGLIFFIFPESMLSILRWIIAILSIASGVGILASELTKRNITPFFGTTALGAIMIVIGLVFATQPGATGIFAIVLGAWFVISSITTLRLSASLNGASAFASTVLSIVSFICGLLLILNPWGGSISMMAFIGIMLIIYAVAFLVDLLVLKSNLKEISKKFKKLVKEAEIIEKEEK